MRNKAIFLDKDGTLVRDYPYNVDPQKIEFLSGVIDGLKHLAKQGFKLFVVSNQSGLARGYFSEEELKQYFDTLASMLAEQNIFLEDMYFCPHHPEGKINQYTKDCHCRKPKAGLIIQAAGEHNIQRSKSWMIGDILNDIEAGKTAGCNTILVDNGHETEWYITEHRTPDLLVSDFLSAAQHIVAEDRNEDFVYLGGTYEY